MLLYYLFWMFMGFIKHFYITFGTSVEGEFRQHDGVVTMFMFYRRRASPKHRYDIIEV